MAQNGSNKKVANSLVAISSAAVLAVYAAGYARTRSAANQFEDQAAQRRSAVSGPPRTASPMAELRSPAPAPPANTVSSGVSASSNPTRDVGGKPDLIASAVPISTTADGPSVMTGSSPADAPAPSSQAAPEASPAASQAVEPIAPAAVHQIEVAAAKPAAPAPVAPAPAASAWKDGTYYGWGTSRHGDIQAEVVIAGGRIAAATIAQCLTRYSCSVISNLPPQVAMRQSPEVDYVSRATQSTNAFYYAVVDALGKAK
jgi:uncharacterized protein with FMN-binding domain